MISQSQIATYLNCSKKYFFKYVEKREPSNETAFENLFVGSFVHNFINAYINKISNINFVLYNTLKRKEYFNINEDYEKFVYEHSFDDIDCFKNYLKKVLKQNVYNQIFIDEEKQLKTKKNTILSLFQTAKDICEFIKKDIDNIFKDFLVESEKHIKVEDLHGYIDLLSIDVDKVKVFDFKITKKERKFKKSIQDLLYVFLIFKAYNLIPSFEYINIIYSNINEVRVNIIKKEFSYTQEDIDEAIEFVENFKKGINYNVFIKNNSSFLCSRDFCEYFDFCQKYQNENEEEINE